MVHMDLEQNGKLVGGLIIRAETAKTSAESVKIVPQWIGINNKTGGCLGFC
mgnify:CR=1 FL=1